MNFGKTNLLNFYWYFVLYCLINM